MDCENRTYFQERPADSALRELTTKGIAVRRNPLVRPPRRGARYDQQVRARSPARGRSVASDLAPGGRADRCRVVVGGGICPGQVGGGRDSAGGRGGVAVQHCRHPDLGLQSPVPEESQSPHAGPIGRSRLPLRRRIPDADLGNPVHLDSRLGVHHRFGRRAGPAGGPGLVRPPAGQLGPAGRGSGYRGPRPDLVARRGLRPR